MTQSWHQNNVKQLCKKGLNRKLNAVVLVLNAELLMVMLLIYDVSIAWLFSLANTTGWLHFFA